MRDFDAGRAERAQRDIGFKVGGEAFRVVPGVHPSVIFAYEDGIVLSQADVVKEMDTLICAFLVDDESRSRWTALCERREDPITTGDRRAIVQYLYEVESELPTIAPEPSSSGRGRGRATSRESTSSPVETAS